MGKALSCRDTWAPRAPSDQRLRLKTKQKTTVPALVFIKCIKYLFGLGAQGASDAQCGLRVGSGGAHLGLCRTHAGWSVAAVWPAPGASKNIQQESRDSPGFPGFMQKASAPIERRSRAPRAAAMPRTKRKVVARLVDSEAKNTMIGEPVSFSTGKENSETNAQSEGGPSPTKRQKLENADPAAPGSVDDIAAQLMKPLLDSFRAKMGRAPTELEYNSLVEVLTSDPAMLSSAAHAAAASTGTATDKAAPALETAIDDGEEDLDWECYANDSMRISFASPDGAEPFSPEYTHQVFDQGEEAEYVYGYKGLEIDLLYTGPGLHAFVDIRFEETRPNADDVRSMLLARMLPAQGSGRAEDEAARDGGKDAKTDTDVKCQLSENQTDAKQQLETPPAWFLQTRSDFARAVDEDSKFVPPSAMKPLSLSGLGSISKDSSYRAYRASVCDVPMFHHLLKFFPLLFIDAASPLDAQDPLWEVIMIFKTNGASGGLRLVGYTTLYPFKDDNKLRLSQILVLPPAQGSGLGSAMVHLAYARVQEMGLAFLEIERPIADGFLRLLAYIDLRRCLASGMVRKGMDPETLDYAPFQKQLQLSKARFMRFQSLWLCAMATFAKETKERDAYQQRYEKFLRTTIAAEVKADGELEEDTDFDSAVAFEAEWQTELCERLDPQRIAQMCQNA